MGNVTATTNALGFATHSQYDALNRPVATTDPLNHTTTSAYDAAGNLAATTNPNHKTRQWRYDALNRRTAAIRPSGATDRFGYDALGNQTAYTNSEGNVYAMAYDTMGRMIAATNALGEQVFRAWHDFNGNVTNRVDGNGNTIANTYDALNQLTHRQYGHGTTCPSEDAFTYDAVGNMTTASNDTAILFFGYDAMNRLTSSQTKIGDTAFPHQWQRDLGGLVTNLTYATGKSVSYTHDQDGLLSTVKDWLGNEWTLTRDAMGKVTGISSPDGNNSTYGYDSSDRLTSWRVGNIARRNITYNDSGLRIRDDITTGAIPKPTLQRTAKNTFDAADRLTSASVRYGQGTNSTPHITESFAYDGNGAMTNLFTRSREGREERSLVFSYNPLGQLSSLQTSHWALATSHFQYDALGSAPSEARRFLRGASPRRLRTSHPLVPSVGTMEEESHPNEVV